MPATFPYHQFQRRNRTTCPSTWENISESDARKLVFGNIIQNPPHLIFDIETEADAEIEFLKEDFMLGHQLMIGDEYCIRCILIEPPFSNYWNINK